VGARSHLARCPRTAQNAGERFEKFRGGNEKMKKTLIICFKKV